MRYRIQSTIHLIHNPVSRVLGYGSVVLAFLLLLVSCARNLPSTANELNATTAIPVDIRFTQEPALELDPHLNSPLAALLSFQTSVPSTAKLQVKTGDFSHTIEVSNKNTTHAIPVLGLRPAREYVINLEVFVKGSTRSALNKTLTLSTEPLPEGFPRFKVTKRVDGMMEPGFTLFDIIPEGDNTEFGSLIAIVDTYGELVWYQIGTRYTDLQQLGNGNILFIEGSKVVEMNMLGERKNEWQAIHNPPKRDNQLYVNTRIFHHEIHPTPRGNFLSVSIEYRSYLNYPTSVTDPNAPRKTQNVAGDVLIEFRPDGSIRHQWSVLDLLDPYRIGWDTMGNYWDPFFSKETLDWSHTNSVIYSPNDNSIIATSRHQDATFKFRRKNGQLLWILSPPENWDMKKFGKYLLKPVNNNEYFFPYHSHAPEIMPNGNLLLYDNGNYRASPPNKPLDPKDNFSRAVEYRIDEDKHEIELVWEYGQHVKNRVFSGALGDANYLPGKNNVLITHGNIPGDDGKLSASILEVTHTTPGEEVFGLNVFDDTSNNKNGWRIYRSRRIADLYGPDTGIKITELSKIVSK